MSRFFFPYARSKQARLAHDRSPARFMRRVLSCLPPTRSDSRHDARCHSGLIVARTLQFARQLVSILIGMATGTSTSSTTTFTTTSTWFWDYYVGPSSTYSVDIDIGQVPHYCEAAAARFRSMMDSGRMSGSARG